MKNSRNLRIIYEDNRIIVADKPHGLLTISTGQKDEVTAYSMIRDYVGRRIFVVHRLDRDTSGLVIFAKDQETKVALQENWQEAVLERKYEALLEGHIESDEGWVETWLYENDKSMKVHCYPIDSKDIDAAREGRCPLAVKNRWQFAATHCRKLDAVLIKGREYTVVEFELETGRKNQIRVHSQWIGHPIAGDKKYGAETNPIGRLALHARGLTIIHPWTGRTMRFNSPVPRAFRTGDKK